MLTLNLTCSRAAIILCAMQLQDFISFTFLPYSVTHSEVFVSQSKLFNVAPRAANLFGFVDSFSDVYELLAGLGNRQVE